MNKLFKIHHTVASKSRARVISLHVLEIHVHTKARERLLTTGRMEIVPIYEYIGGNLGNMSGGGLGC